MPVRLSRHWSKRYGVWNACLIEYRIPNAGAAALLHGLLKPQLLPDTKRSGFRPNDRDGAALHTEKPEFIRSRARLPPATAPLVVSHAAAIPTA
jgi:hypothetical protein